MYVNCKVLFQSCEKWRWRYDMLYSSTLLQVHIYHHFIIFWGIFLEFSLSQTCYIAALCCRSTSTTTSSTTHSEWSEGNSKTTRWGQTSRQSLKHFLRRKINKILHWMFEKFFASEDQTLNHSPGGDQLCHSQGSEVQPSNTYFPPGISHKDLFWLNCTLWIQSKDDSRGY